MHRWTQWPILVALAGIVIAPAVARSQQGPTLGAPGDLRPDRGARALPIESMLVDAADMAKDPAIDPRELRAWLQKRGIPVDAAGRVEVLLSHDPDVALVTAEWLRGRGGEITGAFASDLEIRIEPSRLQELAAALPAGIRVAHPGHYSLDAVAGEGPAVTGSLPYRDLGINGAGVTIAVIDVGFIGLSAAQAAGDAPTPPALTAINYTFSPSVESYDAHGTGCLETVFDHAPGATYRIYKIGSIVDLGTAVADAIANGVDIITHSLSWYDQGWADDSGAACAAANAAANAGILFFTSSGNRAQQHWQGMFADADLDGNHEWSGTDEGLDITVPPGGSIRLNLSWDPVLGSANYDLGLSNEFGVTVAASVSGPDIYESLYFENTSSVESRLMRVVVDKQAGASTEIELFISPGGGFFDLDEHAIPFGSTTSPSNATHPNVVSVGAIDHAEFVRSNYTTGIIMPYSGRGGSNDGMALPDLVGPTNTLGTVYGRFSGTSCATPNAAGAAAVLWSCSPTLPASTILGRMQEWADCQRDFGAPGPDSIYGFGGCWLPPHADCNANNTADACEILSGASVDANCNGVIDFGFCDSPHEITFRIPPVTEPFDFFDGIGEFVTRPEIMEASWATQWPRPWSGFSMGMSHDPSSITPIQIIPSHPLMQLGGGQGPDFFAPELYAAGVTVGVVFDLANQESIAFDEAKPVLEVSYAVDPQLLAGSANVFEREIEFSDTIGNPPVTTTLSDPAGNTVIPAVESGIIELHPDAFYEVRMPRDIRVEIVPRGPPLPPTFILTPMLAYTGEGTPTPLIGMSMAFEYDPALLQPSAVEVPEWIQELNGGNGPTFLDYSIHPDRVHVQFLNSSGVTPYLSVPMCSMSITSYDISSPGGPQIDTSTIVKLADIPGQQPIPPAVFFANNTAAEIDGDSTVVSLVIIEPPEFIRGDCNSSGSFDISDVIFSLNALFVQGSPQPDCRDACDANDDGALQLSDPIYLLNYQFQAGNPPAAPFPACGTDPTDENLECGASLICP